MDEKRMTFGQHLDELRWTLIKCVIAFSLVFLPLLFFGGNPLLQFLSRPLRIALDNVEERAASRSHQATTEQMLKSLESSESTPPETKEILKELITRTQQKPFIVTGPTEAFITYIKVSLITSIFVASPFLAYFIWQFVAAGLYPGERRWVLIFGPVSFACFLAGGAFFYLLVCPYGLQFLLRFGSVSLIDARMRVREYVSFVLLLSFVMGLVFELPLVMLFLTKIGIVEIEDLRSKRRYAYLLTFVLAAMLTPPDGYTQVALALPLIVLYEVGIFLSKMMAKREIASPG